MNQYKKITLISIGGFLGLIVLAFLLELIGLGFFKFFEPKKENIRREVFENTKSYIYGAVQDLAKYYQEYQKADQNGRQTIANVVKFRFSNLDANKIKAVSLRNWFTEIRGY